MIDIRLSGGNELQLKLNRLAGKDAKKIVRSALRKGVKFQLKEVRKRLISFDNPATRARNVFELAIGMRITAIRRTRKALGVRIVTPTREFLGIAGRAPGYWPANMELGTRRSAPQSYLRSTISDTRIRVLRIIAVAIGRGIEKSARKPVAGAK